MVTLDISPFTEGDYTINASAPDCSNSPVFCDPHGRQVGSRHNGARLALKELNELRLQSHGTSVENPSAPPLYVGSFRVLRSMPHSQTWLHKMRALLDEHAFGLKAYGPVLLARPPGRRCPQAEAVRALQLHRI